MYTYQTFKRLSLALLMGVNAEKFYDTRHLRTIIFVLYKFLKESLHLLNQIRKQGRKFQGAIITIVKCKKTDTKVTREKHCTFASIWYWIDNMCYHYRLWTSHINLSSNIHVDNAYNCEEKRIIGVLNVLSKFLLKEAKIRQGNLERNSQRQCKKKINKQKKMKENKKHIQWLTCTKLKYSFIDIQDISVYF